ncbi:hypothetical protein [Mycobacterium sp.]|uniref:hypothetical protein n=1 Tax=Mycobacterium sp. TaxID=1785 RepID=UPI002B6D7515|nr:hypothetical protein [Mycobacterium sp.]HME48252.1 hypothetical protein [Mycobacterium sp.]
MNAAWATAVGAIFVWLGMVMAISFMEAPLKFRAPGVTLPIGLGIGRLVFHALNGAELVLAAIVLVSLSVDLPPGRIIAAIIVALVALAVQLVAVRRWLNRRSDAVLAGHEGPRSRAHCVYIGLEVIKAVALLVSGILLLAA